MKIRRGRGVALSGFRDKILLKQNYQPRMYVSSVVDPAVLRIRIRIHRIHVFLGLPDPDPDPLVKAIDPDLDPAPDPDPSIIMQKW